MAIEKQIIIDINSTDAEKNLAKVTNQFKELGKAAPQSIQDIDDGVENTVKSTKSLAAAFYGVGVAIKALGIGLVIGALSTLKDLFMSNQVIADKFGAAFKALSIAFNDFFNYINKNSDGIVSFFKNIFENPVESLKKFGDLIKENIIERFNSVLEVAGFLSDALVKLFEGDFKGALNSVKEAGKEMVDVFTGVDDTVGKVGDLANAAANYAKETFKAAEALQAQENAALRAAAIQAGLVEQYDRQAEKQRQIRDNDLISVDERIKANNKLKEVLDEQEKAMLAQANLQVQAAQNQYNLNKSIENEVALIDASNNVKGVQAQIEGFRSEQLSNRISLEKELLDLTKAKIESETTLAIEQKKFDAELETNELKKLELQRYILEEEKRIELERLQFNIDTYAKGTQARLDAQIEFDAKKQELDNALTTNEIANLNARMELETLEYEHKKNILNASIGLLDTAASALGESTVAGKAAAVASATMKTLLSSVDAFQGMVSAIPGPAGIAAGIAASGFAVLSGFKTVKNILAVKTPKGSGGVSAPSIQGMSGSAPAAQPQFNVVGNSGVNQLAQTLGNQQPIQAYVVANNVTTAQSLDRNIIQNASLG